MKIDEFYSDQSRKRSGEAPLAQDWRSERDPDATFNLFWVVETGEVCALRLGPVAFGPQAPKPYLVYLPRMVSIGREEQDIAILGKCSRHDVVMDLVTGATSEQRTIEWLSEELATLTEFAQDPTSERESYS